jgi:DNA-binding SARP family transcriptional activator
VLAIGLLGPIEVRQDERVVTPRRQKQRAVLAVLALRAGSVVSSDRLVEELWGERPPKTARHALENYVSELRKALGRDTILTHPSGYVLQVDPEAVDVVRFERLLAEAREQDTESRSVTLHTALALFRGPPLADLAFEPFAQGEVARIEELGLRAREELIDAELELGRHADVIAPLERLVAAHPFRERLRAQLMLAFYRSGRQAEALDAYQVARRILVEELGIDPGVELRALEVAILRQDPDLTPSRKPTGTPAPAPTGARQPMRKTVTIVYAELANADVLADRLDPEPLRAVFDRFRGLARAAVERHGGVCGRLAGETALAVFGVPAAHEDDALRGVRAAVELREGIGVLNDGLLPEAGVFLELLTAVNTGEVLVALDGEDLATGRAVSLAKRLVRGANPGQIILGAETMPLVRDVVEAEPLLPELADREPGAFRLVELRSDSYGRALRLDSPLVGRRRELAALASAFEGVVTSRTSHLFTVLGVAGVGKSRLVGEFLDSVGDVALVLRGRCLPYGETIAFWPLLEALGEAGEADHEATERSEAIPEALEELASSRPLVLVLDDLHWADEALLDLVEQLADSLREAPVVLLCIARPELVEERPRWAGGKGNATTVSLDPLSEAESERLVDNLLGESDLADPVRDHIIRSAEGNPLFVEELLATLVDQDVLRREAGRWTTTEVAAIPMPPTIQALITARLDRLPRDERSVLELASVEGKLFRRDAVAELATPALGGDVNEHLAGLVRKEIVRPRPDGEEFSFRHQTIRDAAYASISMRLRAELHERLADWLAESSEHPELVDYHREQARRYRAGLDPTALAGPG